MARTLLYDIETAPVLGYAWRKWETDLVGIKDEWYILSFAYKWLGDRKVQVVALPDYPMHYADDPTNDHALVQELWQLFNEADITVTHNGVAFDTHKANTRFLAHDLPPPSSYREVDTLRVARRKFAFTSNRLGDICQALGLPAKRETGGFQTWVGCMAGDPAAWEKMKRYNKRDVQILEKLYQRLLPWIPQHPNLATLNHRPTSCPRCGAEGSMVVRGYRWSQATRRARYQCNECGGYSLSRAIEKTPSLYVPE